MHHKPRWEPPRPIGTRRQRITDSVRLVTWVVGVVGGNRTTSPVPRH